MTTDSFVDFAASGSLVQNNYKSRRASKKNQIVSALFYFPPHAAIW